MKRVMRRRRYTDRDALNIRDEADRIKRDAASRWLQANEEALRSALDRTTDQRDYVRPRGSATKASRPE